MLLWFRRLVFSVVIATCTISCVTTYTYADTLQSSHYQFDESVLGSGGVIQSNSASYQSAISIGDTAIGTSASTSYQTQAGSVTSPDPTLSFIVTNGTANFGSFSPGAAAVATTSFTVSDYTSYGYVVQILGAPPSNGSHTLPAMSTTGPSQAGTEQFGINLVANTLPSSVGANPALGQFGFGAASANYGTSNQYRYVSGETIASAPKSSGVTTYTISYIVNVTSLTPGGQYGGNEVIVCTGTY